MMSDETDPENLAYTQRLKAAVHFTVNEICKDVAEDEDFEFSRHMVAVLSETTFRICQTVAQDLELFAKHAKRSTVNADDVKLLARKTPRLLQRLNTIADDINKKTEARKGKRQRNTNAKKSSKSKSTAAPADDDDDPDDDSNL